MAEPKKPAAAESDTATTPMTGRTSEASRASDTSRGPRLDPIGEPAGSDTGVSASFISHLLELRNRLLYAVAAIGVAFVPLAVYSNVVYALLAKPLLEVLPQGASMIATDVASPFLTPIRLALALAVVAAVPIILYQLWAFIAPGLYKHEKRLMMPLLVSSIALFYAGMAFAYFFVFPMAFYFFVHSAPEGVTMMTDIKSYLDFVFSMFFAFGIAFEVPVAVVILVRMGIVKAAKLAEKRSYVIVGIFVAAAILTPPDVYSQLLLAFPMWALFELGLLVARLIQPAEADEN